MRQICLAVALLVSVFSHTARCQEYDIFLLLGQSNMAGRGEMLEEDKGVIADNVFLLDEDGQVRPATNPLNQFSTIKKNRSSQKISPGYGFARKISQKTGRKILLVVNARGGSPLNEWLKGAGTGYFEEAVRRARQAMKQGGQVKAILWHHGESDCRDTTYLRTLSGMVSDLRKEIGGTGIPFIAGEHGNWRSPSKGFNKRLAGIDKYIPNSAYVSAHDCSMDNDPKNPLFSREGQITLGERYAAKVYRMCYLDPDFRKLTARNHPRLFLNDADFKALRKKNRPGTIVSQLNDTIIAIADAEMRSGKVLKYKLDPSGRRILPISRNALKRISSCAYAYRMTGDRRYLEFAEQNMNTVCAFKDWNESHFLDVGEMAMAVAIGYDWLFGQLSEETKANARAALVEKAFEKSEIQKYNRFYRAHNNWNQVCNAGLAAAALATYESNPEIAAKLILNAVETNEEPLGIMYGPDGNYVEGYSYWDYGTLYQSMLLTALETALGTDFGLSETEGFLKTGEFMMFMEGITQSFNYYDSWGKKSPAIAMWYFADRLNRPELLYNEIQHLRSGHYDRTFSGARLLAPMMGYAARIDLEDMPAPSDKMWYGHGVNPVMMIRTKWDGSDSDVYVGIKGGSASNSHSHMDAGSFVFESQGVRWSCDLGNQKYAPLENAMKKLKKSLWDRSQDSGRWDVLRYNNFHHSTITLNDKKHDVKGFAGFKEIIESDKEMGVVIDMTEIFGDDVRNVTRTVKLVEERDLVVTDLLTAPQDRGVNYTWRMVSNGKPEVRKDMIVLRAEGKTMLLKADGTLKFRYTTWSAEPKAYYDNPNEGKYIVGIEADIPEGETARFTVTLSPGQSSVTSEPFGTLSSGEEVTLWRLTNAGGASMELTDYGSRIVKICMSDRDGVIDDVVVGYGRLEQFEKGDRFFGPVIGRFGNRIDHASFEIDGVRYDVVANETLAGEPVQCHGGPMGFDRFVWKGEPLVEKGRVGVRFHRLSPDGEQGFPGNMDAYVTYWLSDDNVVKIEYDAVTDRPTVVNLSNHTYFNLRGSKPSNVMEHLFQVEADTCVQNNTHYCPDLLLPVDGSPFDFREPHRIDYRIDMPNEHLRIMKGMSACWAVRDWDGTLRKAADLYDEVSGRGLETWTTEPALLTYTGRGFNPEKYPDCKYGPLCKFAGMLLETIHFPDSPNQDRFPSTVLRPGERYHSETEYRFYTK